MCQLMDHAIKMYHKAVNNISHIKREIRKKYGTDQIIRHGKAYHYHHRPIFFCTNLNKQMPKNEYNQWGQSVFNHSTNVCENNILRAFLSIPTRLFTLKTTSNWDFLYSWDNHVIAK